MSKPESSLHIHICICTLRKGQVHDQEAEAYQGEYLSPLRRVPYYEHGWNEYTRKENELIGTENELYMYKWMNEWMGVHNTQDG